MRLYFNSERRFMSPHFAHVPLDPLCLSSTTSSPPTHSSFLPSMPPPVLPSFHRTAGHQVTMATCSAGGSNDSSGAKREPVLFSPDNYKVKGRPKCNRNEIMDVPNRSAVLFKWMVLSPTAVFTC